MFQDAIERAQTSTPGGFYKRFQTMARRSKAREMALQMLYQQDLNPDMDYHTVREQIHHQLHDEELYEFAWFLFVGVMECREELDAKIESIAQNWSLKRMAPTDRNVL